VDEYLETQLPRVDSHATIAKVCLSLLLCTPMSASLLESPVLTNYFSSRAYLEIWMSLGCSPTNVSAARKDGQTPLHIDTESGHEVLAQLLIDREADVSAADKDGWTPLHFALGVAHEVVARLLIDRRADVTVADKGGCTPLHYALEGGGPASCQPVQSRASFFVGGRDVGSLVDEQPGHRLVPSPRRCAVVSTRLCRRPRRRLPGR